MVLLGTGVIWKGCRWCCWITNMSGWLWELLVEQTKWLHAIWIIVTESNLPRGSASSSSTPVLRPGLTQLKWDGKFADSTCALKDTFTQFKTNDQRFLSPYCFFFECFEDWGQSLLSLIGNSQKGVVTILLGQTCLHIYVTQTQMFLTTDCTQHENFNPYFSPE